ncbi:MAG: ComF family protein [Tissierellia bacterium]|nr:ComF family protein [Tissierellia bacterium]
MAWFERCPGCGQHEANYYGLCETCYHSIYMISKGISHNADSVGRVIAATAYTKPIDEWIHRYKFKREKAWTGIFVELMRKAILENDIWSEDPLIIPVPIHKKRLKQRGFNQSELLARELATKINAMVGDYLIKTKNTQDQIELSSEKRRENLRGAIKATRPIPPVPILLVDDIITTGSTLSECAKALKEMGATEVHAVVLSATSSR